MRPSCSGGSASDPLGLQPATAPALAVLDKLYATQVSVGLSSLSFLQ